jgi:hypothetical protein
MKAIIYIQEADKSGKLDLKTASIHDTEKKAETHSWSESTHRLSHLTKKGYYSNKPLYIDFATTERVECNGSKRWIVLTDDEYNFLKDNYTQQGKMFETYEQKMRTKNAQGLLAMCSVMKDPYDRG